MLHVDAAALKDLVGGLPQLLADEGGDGLALLILVHHSVLFREKLLSLVEDVNDLHLSAHKIAFVLGAVMILAIVMWDRRLPPWNSSMYNKTAAYAYQTAKKNLQYLREIKMID